MAAAGRRQSRSTPAYALQWYSLAALAVVLAVVLAFRKNEDLQIS